ncbi:MAG: hypothetical protein KJO07_04490, partial [Deltaproteobacteria bacterium]|nr:hypothetical protein [Deltaproteobacteria bacterium]
RRVSPPNRELMAQGVGNMVSGTLGGLPVTSVVIRSSVNVYAGAESRLSTIIHGGLLVVTVLFIPFVLAMIPLSALAAILLVTGFKLFNPRIVKNMWKRGFRQFMPFATTVLAIVFTDLLIGIIIGLAVGLGFVLRGLITSPFIGKARARPDIGEPARFKLAPEVSFLHRAGLVRAFEDVEPGSELVIDASRTEHIDDDAVDIIRNFVNIQSKERDIGVSLLDFGGVIGGEPETKSYVNIFTRDRQLHHSGASALELLREGNERFVTGTTIERDYLRQVELTSEGQHPVAAVLGCIDSRAPAEIIFDKGIGDIFAVRVAGQVLNDDIIGSLEFAAAVANVHLILVLGHTRCGTIKAACKGKEFGHATGLLEKLQPSVEAIKSRSESFDPSSSVTIELVSRDNIERVMDEIPKRSELIRDLIAEGELIIAGGLYRVESGEVDFITSDDKPQAAAEQADG